MLRKYINTVPWGLGSFEWIREVFTAEVEFELELNNRTGKQRQKKAGKGHFILEI